MKAPKKIKDEMQRASRYHQKASISDEIIRNWLKENNVLNGVVVDQYIDSVEYGVGEGQSFINFLETKDYNTENEDDCE